MAGDGGGGGGSGDGGGRTSTRTPSWKERENNRRRERRRRAISAKIFTGLRTYGNYSLPKHCDNNEVLKALCHEAGWIVENDGTTYRKGRKPPLHVDVVPRPVSLPVSPCSSYHPSPYASFNPSPGSSSLASPASSSYAPNTNNFLEGGSLIPWLKNLSSASSSASSSKLPRAYAAFGGRSISAPVTPPFSSSPGRCQALGLMSAQTLTPLQSGTCSPAVEDVPMTDQFVFRSGGVEGTVVKAWEGERIHDDCSDELELTLGCSKTR